NGKKLTIQYDADYFADEYTPTNSVMQPHIILADATPGVVYSKNTYSKNTYPHTSLWVSFDYGKNWIFREENIGTVGYSAANVEGIIYRGNSDGFFISTDFGVTFNNISIPTFIYGLTGEAGMKNCEFWNISGSTYSFQLVHTIDCRQTYNFIPIDSQYMFGQMDGVFPDVYRGGLAGEVYISSWFPDWSYKVSFSADTGHTFRYVYICDSCNPYLETWKMISPRPFFMTDREPGVFYIIKPQEVEDFNPWGWHLKLCVEYYRDYGETLVATYCHDLHKNYGKTCESVNNLAAEIINNNSILLSWNEPESSLPVEEYRVYRNDELLSVTTNTNYIDENLSVGEYEYYVTTYYEMNCISDSSNHVKVGIEIGIEEFSEIDGITIYPNPTAGELRIEWTSEQVNKIEVFDIYGRNLHSSTRPLVHSSTTTINISELKAGIYFVKMTTEKGIIIKKVIKY
ncbi:MAG: T9SS type A sorting domain-containing protein, partial [Lentimicrobiaceae bacterium]|nr:T9SS type A sorting domain-containing protein [Lentimicrobiaceae bacterium]